MPFFGSALESGTTVISLVIGFSIVIVSLVIYYQRQIQLLRDKCREQDIEINTLKNIIISHWPMERVNLSIAGNVTDSNIGASGRNTGSGR